MGAIVMFCIGLAYAVGSAIVWAVLANTGQSVSDAPWNLALGAAVAVSSMIIGMIDEAS